MDIFKEKLGKETAGLTKDQRAAVMHGTGGAVCIAGPGSGKTRVISLRAARLWSLWEEDPLKKSTGSVLTLSFNRPACAEMKTRGLDYIRRMGGDGESAGFYTVHAYCFRLLREYLKGRKMKVPAVLSPEESSQIIGNIYGELSGGAALPADEMRMLRSFILTETGEPDFEFGGLGGELALRIADRYKKVKKELGGIDFGDMLGLALKYLKEDENLRKKARSAYLYTQVDEAQDLSVAQSEIIKLISNGNIFYVADDDQSIYGFRGANPGTVRSLFRDQGSFRTYVLEKNFRSGGDIVRASYSFIKGNDDRFSKKVSPVRDFDGAVSVRYFRDTETQAVFCGDLAKKNLKKNRTTCILYRNNASGLPPLAALYFAAGNDPDLVPRIRGERMLFGELEYVKDLRREISAREDEILARANLFAAAPPPFKIYKRMEKEMVVDRLAARQFGGRRPFLKYAAMCGAQVVLRHASSGDDFLQLTEKIDKFCDNANDRPVNLSTVHSAKGLEFDTVIIIDCVEGEFPFGDVMKQKQLMEERRLMYVAMTRAKDELIIAYPGVCGRQQLTESRFAEEIEEGLR